MTTGTPTTTDDELSDAIAKALKRYANHISSAPILDEIHGVVFSTVRPFVLRPRETLDDIHSELDGTSWTPYTTERVAELLRRAGYDIREPDDVEENDDDA